jgi:hypothetical protein
MSSKAPSQLIKCPVCNLDVKRRGLHSHIRLAHPQVDAKQKLRNVIISPQVKGDRILVQLSLTELNQYRIKYTAIKPCDVRALNNFLAHVFQDFNVMLNKPLPEEKERAEKSQRENSEGLIGGRWDGSGDDFDDVRVWNDAM